MFMLWMLWFRFNVPGRKAIISPAHIWTHLSLCGWRYKAPPGSTVQTKQCTALSCKACAAAETQHSE